MLKVLALAPDHAMHREELIDKLWPDKPFHNGANNLHRGLYDLRHTLRGPWVYVDKGVVRLGRTAWVDVTAFEASVAVGDPASLSTAVTLYGGDLCPDDPYAEIFQAQRDALRQRFLDAALRLAQHTATSGQVAAALDTLRRVLAVDACQEEAHRLLMRLLAQSGRRQDALRQFATCVQALQQTLGTEPAAPTVGLYQAIVRGEIGPGRTPGAVQGWRRAARRLLGTTTPPMLRGRSAALAMLETFVQRREGVLLLIGEAGVGKTRLAVEGARLAEHAHAVILTGVGTELEGLAPYAPFMDAWADYVRLSGAPPTDSPFVAFTPTPTGAPQEDKLRLLQSVQQSLEALSSGKPVYLIIDDLHLVDESSLHLFHYLARATRTQPLMLVATCREEDLRPHTPVVAHRSTPVLLPLARWASTSARANPSPLP